MICRGFLEDVSFNLDDEVFQRPGVMVLVFDHTCNNKLTLKVRLIYPGHHLLKLHSCQFNAGTNSQGGEPDLLVRPKVGDVPRVDEDISLGKFNIAVVRV